MKTSGFQLSVGAAEMVSIVTEHFGSEAANILKITVSRIHVVFTGVEDALTKILYIKYPVNIASENPRRWRDAAVEIYALFLTASVEEQEIEVEIFNPIPCIRRTSAVLPNNQSKMLRAIGNTSSRVLQFVEAHMPSIRTFITYYLPREKNHFDKEPNPQPLSSVKKARVRTSGYWRNALKWR